MVCGSILHKQIEKTPITIGLRLTKERQIYKVQCKTLSSND